MLDGLQDEVRDLLPEQQPIGKNIDTLKIDMHLDAIRHDTLGPISILSGAVMLTFLALLTVIRRHGALLTNLGGQTALNLASKLHEEGILKQYGVEVIGVDLEAIARGESRQLLWCWYTGIHC